MQPARRARSQRRASGHAPPLLWAYYALEGRLHALGGRSRCDEYRLHERARTVANGVPHSLRASRRLPSVGEGMVDDVEPASVRLAPRDLGGRSRHLVVAIAERPRVAEYGEVAELNGLVALQADLAVRLYEPRPLLADSVVLRRSTRPWSSSRVVGARPDRRRGGPNRRAHTLRIDDRHRAARQGAHRPRPVRSAPRQGVETASKLLNDRA
jgi:hypothetical protein